MFEEIAVKLQQGKMFRASQHLLFWFVAYLFFISFFGRANRDYGITIVFASMLFPLAICTSYFLNYFLIPKYLFSQKYGKFILFLGYTLVVTMWVEALIAMFVLIIVSDYQVYKMDPASFDIVFLMVGFYFIILGAMAIKVLKTAFEMKVQNQKLNELKLESEVKLKEAELKLLRAQVHPHFLFNTLNNLYGLTLEKSDLAPQLVLRLSDLMDYMLYKCQGARVNLRNEIEHLRNYVEIERIRYAKKLDLKFKLEGKVQNIKIAPMLLLPFVENAFKHGVSRQIEKPFVKIDIRLEKAILNFLVENSKNKISFSNEEYTGGIGLRNIKKRLMLLYPDKHNLIIEERERNFKVNLQIQLNE